MQPRTVHEDFCRPRCQACWPVDTWPPEQGSVPAPRAGLPLRVVAEVAAGRCVFLRLDLAWSRWFDIETQQDHAGKVRALRWWGIHARRASAPCDP